MNQSKETSQNKDKKDNYVSPVRPIFEKFSKDKDVTLIYGEPISFENQCIVPVAKMNYRFGGGGGGGRNAEKEEATLGQGEGGGGIISVKPLGVYKMSANRVRFKPVIDLKYIVTVFCGLTVLFRKK